MENKLGLAAFAQRLSIASGKPRKLCEDFIKEMFTLCSETLEKGDNIRIKGFGTFKTIETESKDIVSVASGEKKTIEAHKKVVFTAAKELAEKINSPFELFETIELDDDVEQTAEYQSEINTELDSRNSEHEDEISNENNVAEPILEAGSVEEGEDDDITSEAYSSTEYVLPNSEERERNNEVNLPVYYENYPEDNKKFGRGFLWGCVSMFALCLLIFTLGCFFDWWPENLGRFGQVEGNKINTENQITNDANKVPVEEISITGEDIQSPSEDKEEPKVYDTVSTTRYLTTIAREHYGNFNFWPYIYEENKAILGHPDRITPGTKVVVPPLSKYGVDVKNKEDIEAAKKKAVEIYAKYR